MPICNVLAKSNSKILMENFVLLDFYFLCEILNSSVKSKYSILEIPFAYSILYSWVYLFKYALLISLFILSVLSIFLTVTSITFSPYFI